MWHANVHPHAHAQKQAQEQAHAQRTSTRSIGRAWEPYMKIYTGDGGKNIKYERGEIGIDSREIQMYRNSYIKK